MAERNDTLFTRHQRHVVITPNDGEHALASLGINQAQTVSKADALCGVLKADGLSVDDFHLQAGLWQMPKLGVIKIVGGIMPIEVLREQFAGGTSELQANKHEVRGGGLQASRKRKVREGFSHIARIDADDGFATVELTTVKAEDSGTHGGITYSS